LNFCLVYRLANSYPVFSLGAACQPPKPGRLAIQ
jgi:hypothetical protein